MHKALFLLPKKIQKGFADYFIGVISIDLDNALVAVQYFQILNIQNKDRIRDVVENGVIFFFRLGKLFLELFASGNIDAHLHGPDDLPLGILDGDVRTIQ